MKPFKSLAPIANWAIRLAIVLIIVLNDLENFLNFSMDSRDFYISLIALICAAFLLVGGILSKQNLTVIGGLFTSVIYLYFTAFNFSGSINSDFAYNFVVLAGGLYFLTKGNNP